MNYSHTESLTESLTKSLTKSTHTDLVSPQINQKYWTSSINFKTFDVSCNPCMYVFNLFKYRVIDTDIFFIGIILFHRFFNYLTEDDKQKINQNKNTRKAILVVAVMIAAKCHDDVSYNNKSFAMCAEWSQTSSLNDMEIAFLTHLDFATNVSVYEFNEYKELAAARKIPLDVISHIRTVLGII